MANEVLIAYSVFQGTFLLLDIFILTKTGRDIARKGERIAFCILVGLHMAYLVSNTVSSLWDYGLIRISSRTLIWIISTVNLWTLTSCPAAFLMYMAQRMQMKHARKPAVRCLLTLPFLITSFLCVMSPLTGWATILTEDNRILHGPLFLLLVLCSSVNLLAVAGAAAYGAIRGRTMARRQANRSILFAVIIILLCIAVDDMFKKTSVLPAAIFAVIVVIFITMQEFYINSDALTGMNNRRKADDFLADRLDDVSEENPIYLYMCDLDNFKAVNDTYGHAKGDEALILTSQALKRAISSFNGFAARFGGDEFLLAWQEKDCPGHDPEALVDMVDTLLRELSGGKPYALHMTMGYTRCADPKQSIASCLKAADDMLYHRKAVIHARKD